MFYETRNGGCPLQIDPFKALVGPRPIGWISTLSKEGVANLAPYSFFNAVSDNPPMVMFSSNSRKDTIENIEARGEFVCNLASHSLRDAMNVSSASVAPDVDEFDLAGLAKTPGNLVGVPRVGEAPASLECKYLKTVQLTDLDGHRTGYEIVIGQVVGVHIRDEFIRDGRVVSAKMELVARHGYMDYSTVYETFRIERPQ